MFICVYAVNILVATCGVGVGWTSASGVILMSDDTPLQSGKISIEEMSWVSQSIHNRLGEYNQHINDFFNAIFFI